MVQGKRLLLEPSSFDRGFRTESDGHRERYVMTPSGDVVVVHGEREVVRFPGLQRLVVGVPEI